MSKKNQQSTLDPREQKKLLKKKRKKRKIILLVVEVLVLLIVLGMLYVWQALNKIEKDPPANTNDNTQEGIRGCRVVRCRQLFQRTRRFR